MSVNPSKKQLALDHLGEFLTQHLRDAMIEHFDRLAEGYWKAPGLKSLQAALKAVPAQHRATVRRGVISATDAAIHDFLFKLQEQADSDNRISLKVDGIDVVAASDGIHGEAYGEHGWYARFSSYGEHNE